MSLAKTIIYGQVADVRAAVNPEMELDVIDEYGYTPLIQTAIMDDVEKAKIIVNAGAAIDFPDLTGRTALHWAADNNNLAFCQLLLDHQANPNAYSLAGQPILVMPFLRQQKTAELLQKRGADVAFAQDFIHAKLLGHRYKLTGHVDIVDNTNTFIEIDFEGFYIEFTLAMIDGSLKHFKNHFRARALRGYFGKLNKIIKRFDIARQLVYYHHHNIDFKNYEATINNLLNDDFLMIPVGYQGHAISFVRYHNLFAYCDRGAYGKEHGPLNIYRMTHSHLLNSNLIKYLLYKQKPRRFVEEQLQELLGLERIATLPISLQISGNCSWANIEAAVHAMLFMLFVEESGDFEESEQLAAHFFNEWIEWDKDVALDYYINSFYSANPARKASKAAALAAILFQSCEYQSAQDMERVHKIMPILTLPEYDYILKNYKKVFSKQSHTPIGKDLLAILDDFGVDV
ncbi:MAG: ankyrin repeat domain-containing protein [Pseudomonadota bacterium]